MARTFEVCKATLAKHELVHVSTNDFCECWDLREPGSGWMQCARLVFFKNPVQILVTGDLCPLRHGVVSDMRYGIEWFAGRLGESYLCEKFLKQEWVPEKCRDELKGLLADLTEDDDAKDREAIEELLEQDFNEIGESGVRDALCETNSGYCDDGTPGYTYNPRDAGILCGIQQRFAELYRALKAEQEAAPAA